MAALRVGVGAGAGAPLSATRLPLWRNKSGLVQLERAQNKAPLKAKPAPSPRLLSAAKAEHLSQFGHRPFIKLVRVRHRAWSCLRAAGPLSASVRASES